MTLFNFFIASIVLTAHVFAADALNYSGRLVNGDGSPVSIPVNLVFELVYTNAPTVAICSKSVSGVTLVNGVFNRKLDFTSGECGGSTLMSVIEATPSNESIAIKITDTTNARSYAAQAVNAMPYSMMAQMAKTLARMGATNGQVLTWTGTQWAPAAVSGGAGSVTSIATGTGLAGGPITSSGTISIAAGGVTTTQIADSTITNADVSASAAIARSKIATGSSSHVIVNDGSGNLSSVAQLPLTHGGTGASTAAGARTNLGLGNAAEATLGMAPGNAMRPNDVSVCAAGQYLKMNVGPTYFWTCEVISTNDASKVPLDGSVAMTGNLQLGANKITGVSAPTSATDAATKGYVDTSLSGVLALPLTGYAVGTNTALAATDTILQSFGKLQAQISAAGGSGGVWTEGSGNVYRTTGNVGIGTASPGYLFDVQDASGNVPARLMLQLATNTVGTLGILDVRNSAGGGGSNLGGMLTFRGETTTTAGIDMGGITGLWTDGAHDSRTSALTFSTVVNAGSVAERLRIAGNGNVGVGVTLPTTKLQVAGSVLIGNGGETCSGGNFAGALRYNGGSVEFCNGASWQALSSSGGSTPADNTVTSAKITDGSIVNEDVNAAAAIDATKLGTGVVTTTELNYLDGVTSAIQSQLNAKEGTLTAGTATQYLRGDKAWQTLNTAAVPESGNLYFLDSRVRTTLLSGYTTGSALPIASTDTLVEALGKLEAQITANDTAFDNSGQWTLSSGDVYRSSGNVGVGTTSPGAKLHVEGKLAINNTGLGGNALDVFTATSGAAAVVQHQAMASGNSILALTQGNTTTGSVFGLRAVMDSSDSASITIQQQGAGEAMFDAYMVGSGDPVTKYTVQGGTTWVSGVDNSDSDNFKISNSSQLGSYDRLTIDASGNIGLGTGVPTTRLHVAGSVLLGNGGEDCTGGNFAGAIRYIAGAVQFCNGASWQSFSAGGGAVDPANLSSAVPVNKGGTGLTASGSANTILGVNAASSGLEYKSITGAGSVAVSHAAGSVTITGSDTPGGSAGGDLSGTYPSPTVDGLQGRAVSSAAPNSNDVLSFNGTSWIPTDLSGIMGTISVANGGTGSGSAQFTAGGAIVYYNSATTRFEQLTCASDEALKYNLVTGWNCVTADNLFRSWSLKTADYSAVAGDRIFVDTSSSQVTVTLPATPSMGHRIEIVHVGGDLATNKMVIARNGEPIMALAEDMDITSNNVSLEMIYVDATRGWRIK